MKYEKYAEFLKGAGPKMKEVILDRANADRDIDLQDLCLLVKLAYPEE